MSQSPPERAARTASGCVTADSDYGSAVRTISRYAQRHRQEPGVVELLRWVRARMEVQARQAGGTRAAGDDTSPVSWVETKTRHVMAALTRMHPPRLLDTEEGERHLRALSDLLGRPLHLPQGKQVTLTLPPHLSRLHLPEGVERRLHALLDKQDAGEALTEDESAEARGLVELADLMSLLRLRATPGQAEDSAA